MTRKVSIILFWTLIVLSVIGVSRMTWQDWRGSLRTAAFVVPLVVVTSWFRSRFAGPKKRMATVLIYSAMFAMVAGAMLAWDVTLFRTGLQVRSDLMEAFVAGVVFLVSVSVFVWSLTRLLQKADKLPT
jgi:hypothetical protein